ncbi:MAG: GDSL-type esterase/lipase family protein [Huintestinicola sp.]
MTDSKIAAVLLSVAMMAAAGCSDSTAKEEAEMELSDKSFQASADHVKEIGRTYLNSDGTKWLVQSASGIEFTFTGTKASITVRGDTNSGTTWGKGNHARFAVYVNGELTMDALVKDFMQVFEIYSSDTEAETTIKIVKLSESANSTFGISSIDVTSRGDIHPTAEKDLKIEFIGDSITCGYGVDDEVKEHHFSTETEDATKAYAVKTAELLDADYSLVSYSGHGIISGYTDDKTKHPDGVLPGLYPKLGKSYAKSGDFSVSDIDWDFSKFTPDVIVINLGTNDNSYTGGDEERIREYVDGYVAFLGEVRSYNPDSHIICTLGVMGDQLYPAVETAVSEYTEKSGDTKVSAMHFDVQSPDDGYAADWHPTAATHDKAAAKLAEEIKNILNK